MRERSMSLAWCVGLLMLAGCAAKGEVVTLDVHAVPPPSEEAVKKGDVRVVVQPFEDKRSEQGRLGSRSHFFGGQSHFEVPGGKPSEVVAQAVTEYLKAKGWHAELAKAHTDGATTAGNSDVMITGQVQGLAVDAESRFAKTNITANSKIAVQAQNTTDGSVVRMTLNGAGSQSVFWFDPEDAQKLLNDVLTESLEKLVVDTKFEDRLLRLK